MLECIDLLYKFPVSKVNSQQAIQFSYTFQIESGKTVGIVGSSGIGKSTFLMLLAGFLNPIQGTLTYDGVSLLDKEPMDRQISMMFQENNLIGHFTGYQNICLGLTGKPWAPNSTEILIDEKLTEFGLDSLKNRKPDQMSVGQQRRIALLRCVLRSIQPSGTALKKNILLLDEPFNGLDPTSRDQFKNMVTKATLEQKLITLFVSHDKDDVDGIADNVARLDIVDNIVRFIEWDAK